MTSQALLISQAIYRNKNKHEALPTCILHGLIWRRMSSRRQNPKENDAISFSSSFSYL